MLNVTYEEWQLTSLFEVEPEYDHPEDPWPYTSLSYSVQQAPFTLKFSLQPAVGDVSLVLTYHDDVVYEFTALDLEHIEYLKDPRGESLRLRISDRESIFLRVKPRIRVAHELAGC